MTTSSRDFLEMLADCAPNSFERRFAAISTRLVLGEALNGHDLGLLYDAALDAALCCIAFNGWGGCGGEIRPEREFNRIKLEREFMIARDKCFASAGWKALATSQQEAVQRIFLNVFVAEENLAC